MVDRVAELCWLLAALLLGGSPALVGTCGVLVMVHEYVRVRAAAVGMRPAGTATIGDRSTRAITTLVLLVVAGAAAGVDQDLAAGTTTLLLAVWTLLAIFGLMQLLTIIRKALR
jgi:CDP-diacylglycerol--glycerol-3-phosphate 3-phosphatidyltransferase